MKPHLTIWTSADTETTTSVFKDILRSYRPDVPDHLFVEYFAPDDPPTPKPGGVTLVCGTKCLSTLQREKIVPKGRTVSWAREKLFPLGQGQALCTFDPYLTNGEPDKLDLVAWDVRLAMRWMRTGTLKPEIGDYKYVNSFAPMIARIEKEFDLYGKPVDVTCDTETMGFYPWYPDKDIVSISFTDSPGMAEVLYLGMKRKHPIDLDPKVPLFDQISWLLTSPKVRLNFSNGKFDLIWIGEKWGIECTNFKFDNMLVGSMLNENRSNSLNVHAKVMTDLGGYDDHFNNTQDKGHMELIKPDEDYATYAGGDTDAAHRVKTVLKDELLEDAQMTKFYVNLLHPAARAFERVERRGVLVDQEKYAILRDDLSKVIKKAELQALDVLPNTLLQKYRDRIAEQQAEDKSPLLPSILKDFFFSPRGLNLKPKMLTGKTGEPSMTEAHLKQFDHPEAVLMLDAMSEVSKARKTKSTFVDGFLKHIRPDGKFHSTYFLAKGEYEGHEGEDGGTNTGRLSAKDPPFQVIPKKTIWAKRIRECFPAPKGKVMLSCDYSQGELKVVACWAPEPTMLQAYEDGLDLHAVTGAQLAQVKLEEFLAWKDNEDKDLAALFEKHRGNAKPANFGLLYGMSAEGFRAYAWANYGIKLTEQEAEDMRNAFFDLYSGLPTYHDNQAAMVRRYKEVRSPIGRIRHLPMIDAWDREIRNKARRQAINSPIQSCLSDMMIWAIALIDDAYPGGEIEVVGMIHDALIAYVPEDNAELWARRATEVMSNLPLHKLDWKPQLQFTADAELGPNLAALKKVKL